MVCYLKAIMQILDETALHPPEMFYKHNYHESGACA